MPEVIEEAQVAQVETEAGRDLLSSEGKVSHDSLNSFHFKLTVFEGPLDLLLHLIKENKIDIYDIPIVSITHQYMVYLDLMKELNLEIAGEFLVMAATLIHIKSKMLLPPSEEEHEAEEDPRADLIKRLIEYQVYRDSSGHLRKREEIWKNVYQRPMYDSDDFSFEPDPVLIEASVFDLINAFRKLLQKAPEQVIEITRETLTVADKINYIVEKLEGQEGVRFEGLFEEGVSRITLVITFLALLELVRLGLVKIYQEKAFGVIWIINPKGGSTSVHSEKEEVLP